MGAFASFNEVSKSCNMLRLVSTSFVAQSEAKTSNIPHQLHAKYIGMSFQFLASRDSCDLSGNRPLQLSIERSSSVLPVSRYVLTTHQSLLSHKPVYNGGFSNFELPLLVKTSTYMALGGLNMVLF